MTNFADVAAFHDKFDVPALPKPGFLDFETQSFREKFMQEEKDEFVQAYKDGDLATAFDSLLDEVWICFGTALAMGCSEEQWNEMWSSVVKANMSKVKAGSAEDSKRGFSGDIVKPAGWRAPDEEHIATLEKYSK